MLVSTISASIGINSLTLADGTKLTTGLHEALFVVIVARTKEILRYLQKFLRARWFIFIISKRIDI